MASSTGLQRKLADVEARLDRASGDQEHRLLLEYEHLRGAIERMEEYAEIGRNSDLKRLSQDELLKEAEVIRDALSGFNYLANQHSQNPDPQTQRKLREDYQTLTSQRDAIIQEMDRRTPSVSPDTQLAQELERLRRDPNAGVDVLTEAYQTVLRGLTPRGR